MADFIHQLVFSQIIQIEPKLILAKHIENRYLPVSHDGTELRREPVKWSLNVPACNNIQVIVRGEYYILPAITNSHPCYNY